MRVWPVSCAISHSLRAIKPDHVLNWGNGLSRDQAVILPRFFILFSRQAISSIPVFCISSCRVEAAERLNQ